MGRIREVKYRRNAPVGTGNESFQHAYVEAVADVKAGEDPKAVLRDLARFVHAALGIKEKAMPAAGERFIDLDDEPHADDKPVPF